MTLARAAIRSTMILGGGDDIVATERGRADREPIDWTWAKRSLLTAARFIAVHASMLMVAVVLCLFALVLIWLLFDPPPLV